MGLPSDTMHILSTRPNTDEGIAQLAEFIEGFCKGDVHMIRFRCAPFYYIIG